jgi:hypothetical protein
MGPGNTAHWAFCSFDRGLKVLFTGGLTIEERKLLANQPLALAPGSEPLGSWLSDRDKCRCTIYRTGGNWFLQFVSGNWDLELERVSPPTIREPFVQELEQLTASEGLAFKTRRSSERYLVDPQGVLRIVDSDGRLFDEPDPIKLPQPALKK